MTGIALAGRALPAPRPAALVRPVVTVAALGAIVLARWWAWRSSGLDPIAVGAAFGAALLGLGVAAGWRPAAWFSRSQALRAVGLGLGGAAALAIAALIGVHPSWPGGSAGFPLGPWAAATVLVACAEEVVLRGALFDDVAGPLGIPAAVVITSAVFALMHVPVYGWQAVPLDAGVGVLLSGLRLLSGGVAAPAIAHALADLVTVLL
jgi:membrane protease YdiL (CAAX protease family)